MLSQLFYFLSQALTHCGTFYQSTLLFFPFSMQPVLPAFKKQLTTTREQIDTESQELRELEFKLESMSISIREPPPVRNSRQICSHCHYRGHRNNSSNPCKLPKCKEYTYCGIKEKHPEYQYQINCLTSDIKKKNETRRKTSTTT